MTLNLSALDLDTLKAMYEKEKAELQVRLLDGATWEETKQQRKNVIELSIALDQRVGSTGQHPAESSFREQE